jgi:hypothetical protein
MAGRRASQRTPAELLYWVYIIAACRARTEADAYIHTALDGRILAHRSFVHACARQSLNLRQGDLVQSSHVKQQQWEASSSSSACLHAM